MCGIFGYIGGRQAKDIIIKGLKLLEYRGYDSAGIALFYDGKINVSKKKGRIAALEDSLKDGDYSSFSGIGHTRWATHGKPSDENAHPFMAQYGKFAVVHNGIIENYLEIKEELEQKNYRFFSQTDSEIIANLIDSLYTGSVEAAVLEAVKRLRGSFALGILSIYEKDTLFAVKKDSPLIVGLDKGESFICSDINSLQSFTDKVVVLKNGEIARIEAGGLRIINFAGAQINPEIQNVKKHNADEYLFFGQSFMYREINEIPAVLKKTYDHFLKTDILRDFDKEYLKNISRINVVSCGTALNAGLVGAALFRKYSGIDVFSEFASEFKYGNYIVDGKTLTIAISQSGETADTLSSVKSVKSRGGRVLSITNVATSSIVSESDYVLLTLAGPEIAVASTKAYNCQVMTLILFALSLARLRGDLKKAEFDRLIKKLGDVSDAVKKTIEAAGAAEAQAIKHHTKKSVFFLGRGTDFFVAQEGSLKLKEISYINSEAYASGEIKHGPLALIENGVLVVSIITGKQQLLKSVNALSEVKSRGATVLVVTPYGEDKTIKNNSDAILPIPETEEDFYPLLSVVPLQFFAYYMAKIRGCDIDKPRNLAKSVTVE
jgi:glucosamine--fructose-6-phosphate aminotransferase (isomerizing)